MTPLQVTFTAIVFSTSSGQPLGPSSGTVTFSVSGSDAFKWVKPTVLGTGVVSQDGVSGVATLIVKKATEGLTLLPGDCSSSPSRLLLLYLEQLVILPSESDV